MNTPNNIYNLFPVPVVEYDLERNFTDQELEHFLCLEKETNLYNYNSVDTDILSHNKINDIGNFIKTKLQDYFVNVYQPRNKLEIYITQSWINYSDPGQSHHKHAHPNSLISGVLYIDVDESVDNIKFHRNDPSVIFHIPSDHNNIWNSGYWKINNFCGQLLLFPSTLPHSVDEVPDSKKRLQRISLSFNSFVKGHLGNSKEYTELTL